MSHVFFLLHEIFHTQGEDESQEDRPEKEIQVVLPSPLEFMETFPQ